MLRDQTL